MADGGMFGVDTVRDYFQHKVKQVKGRAADYVADEVVEKGSDLAGRLGSVFGERAGSMSRELAHEILEPRAKARLRELVGAGATQEVRRVLGQYRRWLAHGKAWDTTSERQKRRAGGKTVPLTREQLMRNLALVGVDRNWDKEKWSRTAMQKGLNLRLRQLFSKRTRKNDILQLIEILDNWRKAYKKGTKRRGKKAAIRELLVDKVEKKAPGLIARQYYDQYEPAEDLVAVSRGTIEPRVRKPRKLSVYNLFMRAELGKQRGLHPEWANTKVFSAAVGAWKKRKQGASTRGDDEFLSIAEYDSPSPTVRPPGKRIVRKRPPGRRVRPTKKKQIIQYPSLGDVTP